MAKTGSVVASEGSSGGVRGNDDVAVDGRITKIGLSGRENGLAERFETTEIGKRMVFLVFAVACTFGGVVAGWMPATLGGESWGSLVW